MALLDANGSTAAATLASLLGGVAVGTQGVNDWTLAETAHGEVVRLHFTRDQTAVELWLRPATAQTAAWTETAHFKLGYRGQLPDGGDSLLAELASRVRAHEGQLTRAALVRLFEGPGRVDELDMSWGAVPLRLTLRCNENCPFCSASHAGNNLVTERDRMHEAIDKAAAMGARMMLVTGGEPTLIPWLPDLVAHMRRLGLRCRIETNGVIPSSAEYWRQFAALPDELFVSFHTQHPERLQALTGLSGTFERKLSCIHTALGLGIHVIVNVVATTANLDEIGQMPAYLAQTFGTGVEVMFSVAAPLQRASANFSVVPRASLAAAVLAQALDSALALGVRAVVPDVCGLPRCVLPGRAEAFAATDRAQALTDQDRRSLASPDHVKGPNCTTCVHDATCLGIWRQYADNYGFDEFRPVQAPHA
ncbi:MAG: radical SAM protein [Deltaproteobacteria bacterium]|nr:radical SAM protein [Deltaproteobacteria bacterium]